MYRPDFAINNNILKYIGEIEAAKEVIEHAPLLPYWEKKFQDDAVLRTTHYGTHIEGNELSLSQVQKVLDGERIVARDRDVQEVINYRKVVSYIGDKKDSEISESTIKKLHKLTVENILDEGGKYREKEVVIRNSITGEISFHPPKAVEVEWQMKDLIEFILNEKDIHPVLIAGIVHYEFVRIHPFLDGNGRVGRALSMLVLFTKGYDIREFFSLEEHFDRNAVEYYKALQNVALHNGDVTEWLEYFCQCLAVELSKIKEKIERISVDNKMKEKLGGTPVMLTDRQLKIIEYIQEVGYLENKVFASLFPDVSEDTALREVQDLVKKMIIVKKGKTKGVKYLLNKE